MKRKCFKELVLFSEGNWSEEMRVFWYFLDWAVFAFPTPSLDSGYWEVTIFPDIFAIFPKLCTLQSLSRKWSFFWAVYVKIIQKYVLRPKFGRICQFAFQICINHPGCFLFFRSLDTWFGRFVLYYWEALIKARGATEIQSNKSLLIFSRLGNICFFHGLAGCTNPNTFAKPFTLVLLQKGWTTIWKNLPMQRLPIFLL